jgi:hypothetical protein
MTVTFYRRSIAVFLIILLAGCSTKGETPDPPRWKFQQTENLADGDDPSALEVCLPDSGAPFHLRKAILVAGTIGVPHLARDLPGISYLTSKRLQTHLAALERFNLSATHNSSFESMGLSTAARVRQLGREYTSQFVVKLEFEDLTMHSSGGMLSRLLRGPKQRDVLIKLYIYDTEHGALFHSQQYEGTVSGDVVGYPGKSKAVTTSWFNTDLGKQIDEIIKDMSTQINEILACVPFSTQVTAVEGNNIHIKAGFLHGIRPGETLRVYPRSDLSPSEDTLLPKQNDVWIKVSTVFPKHSIARATQDSLLGNRLDTGDVVRAW